MIIVTTPNVPGYKIKEVKGIVMGLTPRTRGLGGKFIASLESLFGGEITSFTSEMEKARKDAINRMIKDAKNIGANAVIGVDIETTEIFQGVVLISATGTAVTIEKE